MKQDLLDWGYTMIGFLSVTAYQIALVIALSM
jgi:hypothetical protein